MQLKESLVEALIGAVVVLVAALFLVYAYTSTAVGGSGHGYPLVAHFPSATGVSVGTDVRISGIKVGSVTKQELDPQTFQAKVTFTVQNGVELPVDTIAKIASEGILGGNYIELAPGGEMDTLKPGEEIEQTQGSVDLMGLIGRAIYSATGSDDGKSSGGSESGAAAEAVAE